MLSENLNLIIKGKGTIGASLFRFVQKKECYSDDLPIFKTVINIPGRLPLNHDVTAGTVLIDCSGLTPHHGPKALAEFIQWNVVTPFELAAKVIVGGGRYVYLSSAGVYSAQDYPASEDEQISFNQPSSYGRSKVLGERALSEFFSSEHESQIRILRVGSFVSDLPRGLARNAINHKAVNWTHVEQTSVTLTSSEDIIRGAVGHERVLNVGSETVYLPDYVSRLGNSGATAIAPNSLGRTSARPLDLMKFLGLETEG